MKQVAEAPGPIQLRETACSIVELTNEKAYCCTKSAYRCQRNATFPGPKAGRPVTYGCRQSARAGIGYGHSRNLGRRVHELQCGSSGIKSSRRTNPPKRQAVVPDDGWQGSGETGAGRPHAHSASIRSWPPPPVCIARLGWSDENYRGCTLRLLVVGRTPLKMSAILRRVAASIRAHAFDAHSESRVICVGMTTSAN